MTSFMFWQALAVRQGLFFCCICYETLPIEQAWQDRDGVRWDMCPACGWEQERARQANTPK